MNKLNKVEKSWIMYDWANSVYATIIMAAVFPIYFSTVAKANGMAGDVYWGYATSIATFAVAISAPIIGAIGDFKGMKKRLFSVFLFAGTAFTLIMALTDKPMLMLVGYAVSYIGYAGANLCYDSFLTDVTTHEKMDKVSAYGFAMGYIGGSTIPFLISIALITFGSRIGIDNPLAVKISVVITSIWWALFSIPILRNVKQVYYVERPTSGFTSHIFANIKTTLGAIVRDKKLLFFLLAYFFYIDGVGTIIHMATSYGSTLGLGTTGMILALLVTQIVAVPCSILFSKFSSKIGTIKMLLIGIAIYIVVCVLGFFMGFFLEPQQETYEIEFMQVIDSAGQGLDSDTLESVKRDGLSIISVDSRAEEFSNKLDDAYELTTNTAAIDSIRAAANTFLTDTSKSKDYDNALGFSSMMFWALAVLVGTSQGGMQALSRSYFGKLIPPERSNEFFGFFDIFGKFAAVMGPALYALFAGWTGRSSMGILSLVLLFLVGGAILIIYRKDFARE